ncbi:MAG: hypothetical protein CVV10_09455 [Gammaproteobacteria bacterium HGW-Gammaproteobacteria-14]|nr:MAG: hypothetical protein CVV10_09455 [Gammaproteobacteria bacterium HGW-Gammaproteobacteria-14]
MRLESWYQPDLEVAGKAPLSFQIPPGARLLLRLGPAVHGQQVVAIMAGGYPGIGEWRSGGIISPLNRASKATEPPVIQVLGVVIRVAWEG